MRLILLTWIHVVKYQIIAHFRESKDGRLFEGWALILEGAYLIILCLGWALIRGEGTYSRGSLNRSITVADAMVTVIMMIYYSVMYASNILFYINTFFRVTSFLLNTLFLKIRRKVPVYVLLSQQKQGTHHSLSPRCLMESPWAHW